VTAEARAATVGGWVQQKAWRLVARGAACSGDGYGVEVVVGGRWGGKRGLGLGFG
jgi:hypothetical protein